MPQKILPRALVVVFVVLVSFYYVIPSFRVINYKISVKAPSQETDPEAASSYTATLRRLENSSLPFGAVPIRFGLDLEGGTDITIALDEDATIRDRLAELERTIRRDLRRDNVSAPMSVDQAAKTLTISLSRSEQARAANIIVERYKGEFEPWDTAAFEQGRKVVLTLSTREITRTRTDAISAALKVIRNRVDALGLVQPIVVKQGENRIRVQMPGVKDPNAVIQNIIKPAQLEFRILHKDSDAIIQKLFTPEAYKEVCAYVEKYKKIPDTLPLKADAEIPSGYVLRPGEWVQRGTGAQGAQRITHYKPWLVKENVELTGARLRNAHVFMNAQSMSSPWEISLQFDRQGAVEFRDITGKNVGEQLAILLDNFLYSAPVIKVVIPNGAAVIEGAFSQQEALDLSLVLKAGALPANLKPTERYVVEATLGADSIRKGVEALVVGTLAVIVFMIGYYGTAGAIAIVALAINVLMILAIMCLARATLTLSGIGGILLTIGMAVDANVLIYERIREEKATARGLKMAVSRGFQRAFSVIFDSNLTTLITTLVLLQFGTGSVQGFALTTTFGIFATLFTGLFCTHLLVDLYVQWRNNLSTGWFTMFRSPKFDIMGWRFYGYALSALVIGFGIAGTIAKGGLRPGVEFTGGLVADVRFQKPTSEDEIKRIIDKYYPTTPIVQRVQGENRFLVRVSTGTRDPQEAETIVRKALEEHPSGATIGGVTAISSEIGGEFIKMAIIAIIFSWVGMLVYLWFRFELIFGAGAIVSLIHDTVLTLALVTALGQEISLDVVAGLLILIGYSANDTIVIFDRIRETFRTTYGMPYREMLNHSINVSLNRTSITSLCTLFTTGIMLLLGGPGLRPLALTLTIGIITGTYSSDFIATPVIYEWHLFRRRQQAKGALGTPAAANR
jgi:SecD/SecF fusion protein